MKVFIYFSILSHLSFSEKSSIFWKPNWVLLLLQEGARVPAMPHHLHPAGLSPSSSANSHHHLLSGGGGSEAGQPQQSDGGQGPQHQSVQWALHLPLPPLSRLPVSPGPGQDVSIPPGQDKELMRNTLQIFHAKNYSILWCGFHQWGPS